MRLTFFFLVAWFSVGCASLTRQTRDLIHHPPDVPRSAEVSGVPFIEQKIGHCGPATLTMAMNWAGHSLDVTEVAPAVFTPGKKGSLQADMIGAARRQGFLAIPIEGLKPLVEEIASGHPVIVLQNLGLKWLPEWHYAIAHGYDLDAQQIRLHSGAKANQFVPITHFEFAWRGGEYWGLLILPPDRLAKTADELAHLQAAAGLEQLQKDQAAQTAYQKILSKWPNSLGALVGLGNLYFKRKEYRKAVAVLRRATKNHPGSVIARHNLKVAEQVSLKK